MYLVFAYGPPGSGRCQICTYRKVPLFAEKKYDMETTPCFRTVDVVAVIPEARTCLKLTLKAENSMLAEKQISAVVQPCQHSSKSYAPKQEAQKTPPLQRFYESSKPPPNADAPLQPAMDIFSLGCVIAELFLEGQPLFTLSQLLQYRNGLYDPAASINKVSFLTRRKTVRFC
jgi:hypothetical protein